MNDLNRWEGIGRFGADPETRVLPNSNRTTVNANIACNSSWVDRTTGERHDNVEWIRVVFYGVVAETVGAFCTKGTQIFVQGRLQTRSWIGTDGFKRYTTEVIVDNPYSMQMLQSAPTKAAVTARDDSPPPVGAAPSKPLPSAESGTAAEPKKITESQSSFNDEIPF